MTGYLFLVLATFCGTAKGYAGKKSSSALDSLPLKLYFGAFRTALCAVIGLVIWLAEGNYEFVGTEPLVISVLSGISMSIFLLSWIAAVRGKAYVLIDVCCQMGMVIPCIFAAPVLGENITVVQYIALAALVIAIILLSDKGKKDSQRIKIKDVALLAAVWISSGTNSLTVKLYASTGAPSNTFYNLVTFSVSAFAFAVAYMIFRGKQKCTLPKKHYTAYLPVMAVCLYLNIFLQTLAAKHLDSMVMFPLQTVMGLLLSALMAALMFKEKPTAKNIVGMAISAASLVIMNLK